MMYVNIYKITLSYNAVKYRVFAVGQTDLSHTKKYPGHVSAGRVPAMAKFFVKGGAGR